MAAHTQTLTKSDCLNHTEKDRILYQVSIFENLSIASYGIL